MDKERFNPKSEVRVKRALGKVVLSSVVALSASQVLPMREQERDMPNTAFYDSSMFKSFNFSDPEEIEIAPAPVLSEKQIKKIEEKKNLENVIGAMKVSEAFPKKYIKDVKIYYPIYKAVADKYKIDWYLLFIVHEKETGASKGWRGFAPDSYYVGAMQRDPNIWTEDYVDKAFEGLGYLSKLPQRRKGDAREIAAAARMLSDNYEEYRDRGDGKLSAVKKTLIRYSALGPALTRFNMYEKYKRVFDKVPEYEYQAASLNRPHKRW